ncbi:hypothetical protein AGMMS49579_18810 [Spirochaetia bacterium]|nr:hypothetical protein AGMMS49579_18810 [Spirochaetia bacterium]
MRRLFVVLLFLCASFSLWAQNTDLLDSDMDSLFDEPVAGADTGEPLEPSAGDGEAAAGGNVLAGLVRQKGFSLEASYYFHAGIAPGWNPAPWDKVPTDSEYSTILGVGMSAGIGLDFQISDVLRVKNSFGFSYPDFSLTISEFFLDYSIRNVVFIRAGKYGAAWGISRNFQFANLLSRVPDGSSGGDPITIKVDIPIGVGGLQALGMTRIKDDGAIPRLREIGFGGKYNLAFTWADIDLGVFYLDAMPLRAFFSVKTTIKNTELYTEGAFSVQHKTWDDWKFSANLGVVQSFFADKFTINGEVFYNGEAGAGWFRPKSELREADVSPFIGGFNTALNLAYRPGVFFGLRVFTQFLYGINENTFQLVPGLTFDPLPHMTVSLAVPMALGDMNGTYYSHNADTRNRPFSVVLLVSLNGSHRFGLYE